MLLELESEVWLQSLKGCLSVRCVFSVTRVQVLLFILMIKS